MVASDPVPLVKRHAHLVIPGSLLIERFSEPVYQCAAVDARLAQLQRQADSRDALLTAREAEERERTAIRLRDLRRVEAENDQLRAENVALRQQLADAHTEKR